jgi:hypothetical protein
LDLVRRLYEPRDDEGWQVPAIRPVECPACESVGGATGYYDVEWKSEPNGNQVVPPTGTVWFLPAAFECGVCGLQLHSEELAPAAMGTRQEIPEADPLEYEAAADESGFNES